MSKCFETPQDTNSTEEKRDKSSHHLSHRTASQWLTGAIVSTETSEKWWDLIDHEGTTLKYQSVYRRFSFDQEYNMYGVRLPPIDGWHGIVDEVNTRLIVWFPISSGVGGNTRCALWLLVASFFYWTFDQQEMGTKFGQSHIQTIDNRAHC